MSKFQQINRQQIIIDHADDVTHNEWWKTQIHRYKNNPQIIIFIVKSILESGDKLWGQKSILLLKLGKQIYIGNNSRSSVQMLSYNCLYEYL